MEPPPVYMEQPKTPMQGILANMDTQVLKEPRGFIKLCQFVLGIFAFATTTSFSTTFAFTVVCSTNNNSTTVEGTIDYPFQVDDMTDRYTLCDGSAKPIHIDGDFSSDARFFVAIGVISFLYTIAALVMYMLFSSLYDTIDLVPIGDCGMHVILAFLWLAASSAWASGKSNLTGATSMDVIIQQNMAEGDICGIGYTCTAVKGPNYSTLTISLLFGFLNTFLWGSNLWFLYKETRYFKDRMKGQEEAGTNPPGA